MYKVLTQYIFVFSQGFSKCSSIVLKLISMAFFAVPLYGIKATETLYLIL